MIDDLLEYVDHQLKLGERSADGSTLRDHLLSAQRQTGTEHPALLPAECLEEAKYIYEDYFLSMSRRRISGSVGPGALSNAEVQAWARLRGVTLSLFEIEALDRIESLWLERCYENIAKRMPTP